MPLLASERMNRPKLSNKLLFAHVEGASLICFVATFPVKVG